MRWILDDMVFGDISHVVSANDLATWPNDELLLADATAQAAVQDISGRRQSLLAATSGATGPAVITSFTVKVDSEAGRILYEHLRSGTGGTAGLAECESIAWALTHPDQDSILVTRDKHAAMLALAELGRGRVCHAYELFEYLYSRGSLTQQKFKDLLEFTSKRDKSIPVPLRLSPRQVKV